MAEVKRFHGNTVTIMVDGVTYTLDHKDNEFYVKGKKFIVKDTFEDEDQDIYNEHIKPNGTSEADEIHAKIKASLGSFYDVETFPEIASDGTIVMLFDEMIYLFATGKPLQPKYTLEWYNLSADKKSVILPSCAYKLRSFDFKKALESLN